MRQFRSYVFGTILILIFALALTACGGGGSTSNNNTTYNLVLTPKTPPSLNFGQVTAVVASLQDANGNGTTSGKISWTSSNTNLLTVSPTGGQCGDSLNGTNTTCLCAGTWDANIIDCKPATTSGTATLTASDGTRTATTTVYVHPRIARVVVGTSAPSCSQASPDIGDCTSSTGTLQLQAKGCDAAGNEINVGPTDGTAFTWNAGDANVATTSTAGLYTAVNPGITTVYASINNVASTPLNFSTCAVKKISLHVSSSTDTSFSVASGTSKTVAADVIDTKDKTITIANSKLGFFSANNGAITIDASGNVTTPSPATSSLVAICAPPNCNTGFNPIFSNPVVANATGTNSTQVIVASKSSTSLFPIDATAGTVGTAVTLPANPNSLIFARTSLGAYLGAPATLIAYDNTKNAAVGIGTVGGIVQSISNDAGELMIYDNTVTTNNVRVVSYNGTGTTPLASLSLASVPANCATTDQCPRATFLPDNKTAYVAAGTNLYVVNQNFATKTIPLGAIAKDIAASEQGSFVFVAMPNNAVDVYATCNNANVNSVGLPAVPQRLVSSIDGTRIFVANPPSLSVISVSTDFTGCPPSLTNQVSNVDLGQGAYNTHQLLITSDGSKVAVITDTNVIIFNTADSTFTPVTLAGNATPTTGGMTLDSKTLWVGGNDSKVHKIDLTAATPTDTQQIAVTISPDLVDVKKK